MTNIPIEQTSEQRIGYGESVLILSITMIVISIGSLLYIDAVNPGNLRGGNLWRFIYGVSILTSSVSAWTIWRRKNGGLRPVLICLVRSLLGLLFAVGSLFLLKYVKVSSLWGFSLLILIGVVATWIAGKPVGWAIAALSVWVWLGFFMARDYITLGHSYEWDLVRVIGSKHIESLYYMGPIFSVCLLFGGLLGGGLSAFAWVIGLDRKLQSDDNV